MSSSELEATDIKIKKVAAPEKKGGEASIKFTKNMPASDEVITTMSEPLTPAEVDDIKGDALAGRFVTCERGDRLIIESGFLAVQARRWLRDSSLL